MTAWLADHLGASARRLPALALVVAVLALAVVGCAAPPRAPVVQVVAHRGAKTASGWGLVAGPGRVVTAAHVVYGRPLVRVRYEGRWLSAELRDYQPSWPEPMAVLEVDLGPGIAPAPATRRLVKGDSGTPVYDSDGRCVGLVHGTSPDGQGVTLLGWGAP